MPHFHPPVPPHFLSERMRDAERAVWEVLRQLDYSWHVFYSARENSESGWDREVDFVLIRLNRIFYCEVKGGIVVVDQRAGPGVTWTHLTRSGEVVGKRADPKQLWLAKAALGKTISQIAGESPRDLGFREHDFYIFPHTPKEVAQGVSLERRNTHYAFAEDIETLPIHLQQIVESGKGRFIDRNRIASIIDALDALVIKGGTGVLPRLTPAVPLAINENRVSFPLLFPRPIARMDRPSLLFRRRKIRIPSMRRAAAVFLGVVGLLAIYADSTLGPSASRTAATVAVPQKPKTAVRSDAAPIKSELPPFIAPASADDVERAIAAARDRNVYVSWRSATQHGLVLLLENEDSGCRRYQVSRHDIQPAVYSFVRRCP